MFQNQRLSIKLIGGFVFVALITLVVGYMGWSSASKLNNHLEVVGKDVLPSVQSLGGIEKELETMRVAQRTLFSPDLKKADWDRKFHNVAEAQKRYKKDLGVYEGMPKTPRSFWYLF